MTDEDTILGLIAAAEEHQRAAKTAIEGLAAERAALARAVQGIQKAAGEAVADAARQSLADASETAVAAFSKAAEPFTQKVEGVADKADKAANRVNSAAKWIGVKAVAFVVGCIVVAGLAAWVSLAWEHHQVNDLSAKATDLQTQIVDLKTQIQQLREGAAVWGRKAGKATLRSCGPRGRLCVKVDTKAGTFGDKTGTYMIISGY
ncbi:MAG: hypothetical protein ACP5SH_26425 [Syntrophobacteraceae bacterium]